MYENLMESAVSGENYKLALQTVTSNKGAAGIDSMTTAELEPHLQANWWILKDKLLKGTCVPSPVRREDTEAEPGHTDAGNPDGTGSVYTAVAGAGADAGFRSAIQRAQLWVSATAH